MRDVRDFSCGVCCNARCAARIRVQHVRFLVRFLLLLLFFPFRELALYWCCLVVFHVQCTVVLIVAAAVCVCVCLFWFLFMFCQQFVPRPFFDARACCVRGADCLFVFFWKFLRDGSAGVRRDSQTRVSRGSSI